MKDLTSNCTNTEGKLVTKTGLADTSKLHGFVLGLGVKNLISDNIFAFSEVNYAAYKDKSIPSGGQIVGDITGSACSGNV
jgi:hypothetical protein